MKKNVRLCLKIIETILFVFCSVLLFRGFVVFASDLDDFSHQWRLLPIEIGYMLPTYALFIIHLLIYPESEKKLHQTLLINGIVISSIALLGIIITSIYLGIGVYSFADQVFSVIFPLDVYLFFTICLTFGGYLVFFDKIHLKDEREYFPCDKKKWQKGLSFLRAIYALLALYFFGALIDAIFLNILNASSSSYFFIYILVVYSPMSFIYYEFFMRNHGEINLEMNKGTKVIVSSIHLGIAFILVLLSYIFLLINPYYVAENFQMWLPLDFMGSLELFIYLITLPLLGYAIYFFIMALRKKELPQA